MIGYLTPFLLQVLYLDPHNRQLITGLYQLDLDWCSVLNGYQFGGSYGGIGLLFIFLLRFYLINIATIYELTYLVQEIIDW